MYTSGSLALAALEILVHVDQKELPAELFRVEIDLPDDLEYERLDASLPAEWRAFPAPATLQRLGDSWLQHQESLVLQVPSAVIPQECNYLINPSHPELSRLSVVRAEEFIIDPRLAARAGTPPP